MLSTLYQAKEKTLSLPHPGPETPLQRLLATDPPRGPLESADRICQYTRQGQKGEVAFLEI